VNRAPHGREKSVRRSHDAKATSRDRAGASTLTLRVIEAGMMKQLSFSQATPSCDLVGAGARRHAP